MRYRPSLTCLETMFLQLQQINKTWENCYHLELILTVSNHKWNKWHCMPAILKATTVVYDYRKIKIRAKLVPRVTKNRILAVFFSAIMRVHSNIKYLARLVYITRCTSCNSSWQVEFLRLPTWMPFQSDNAICNRVK